jgi:SAM-dependent methyltransferase
VPDRQPIVARPDPALPAAAWPPPFAEDEYGVVKRVTVVGAWVQALGDRRGRALRVLDYGCGTGEYLTLPLARLGHAVLGVDQHTPTVEDARRRHALPNLRFRAAVLATLVAEEERFDLVVASEVLEHLDDPGAGLSQLRRLLRPGGQLVITTPNGYGAYELLCRLERALKRGGVHGALRWTVWRARRLLRRARRLPLPASPLHLTGATAAPGFLDHGSGHVQFFTRGVLERLFRDAGLRVIERRARTLLCGPYADPAFRLCGAPPWLLRANGRLADLLPLACAADWMFLLERAEDSER